MEHNWYRITEKGTNTDRWRNRKEFNTWMSGSRVNLTDPAELLSAVTVHSVVTNPQKARPYLKGSTAIN